jgi:ABC-2 type transport system permease protein
MKSTKNRYNNRNSDNGKSGTFTPKPYSTVSVMKTENRRWFCTPVIYFTAAFSLAVSSGWFFLIRRYFETGSTTIRDYFGTFPFIFIILIPALIASSDDNEKSSRGNEWHRVSGKFLSFLIMLSILLLLTLPVPLLLSGVGQIDAGKVVTEYFGLFFLGSCCIAVGIFSFYLFKTYISRFLFSVAVLLFFTVINRIAVPSELPDGVKEIFIYLSFDHHLHNFIHGILNSNDILYFVLICFGFLFSAASLLRARGWSETG